MLRYKDQGQDSKESRRLKDEGVECIVLIQSRERIATDCCTRMIRYMDDFLMNAVDSSDDVE